MQSERATGRPAEPAGDGAAAPDPAPPVPRAAPADPATPADPADPATPADPAPPPPAEDDEAVALARAWVQAVMDERDLGKAWPITDPPFRKVLAQHWILQSHPDVVGPPEQWEALADRLAACPSRHPLWERFARERVARWREFWPGFSAVTWGVRSRTEPRPGIVVVAFVEPRGKLMSLRPGPPLQFRHLAVRRRPDGWLLAGLDGAHIFKPGWPPGPA